MLNARQSANIQWVAPIRGTIMGAERAHEAEDDQQASIVTNSTDGSFRGTERVWRVGSGHHLNAPVALLVFVAIGAIMVSDVYKTSPVTVDEPHWITSGYLTYQLVVSAAGPSEWATAYDALRLGDWGNKNPPVGKFLVGVATAPLLSDPH